MINLNETISIQETINKNMKKDKNKTNSIKVNKRCKLKTKNKGENNENIK